MKTGEGNDKFCSEIGSGFGGPSDTPLQKISLSAPLPRYLLTKNGKENASIATIPLMTPFDLLTVWETRRSFS